MRSSIVVACAIALCAIGAFASDEVLDATRSHSPSVITTKTTLSQPTQSAVSHPSPTVDEIVGAPSFEAETAAQVAQQNAQAYEANKAELQSAVANLAAALSQAKDSSALAKVMTAMQKESDIQSEYKAARQGGADALALRSIAQRFVAQMLLVKELWQASDDSLYAGVMTAYENYALATFKFDLGKRPNDDTWMADRTKLLEPVAQFDKLNTVRVLSWSAVWWASDDALTRREQSGEAVTEATKSQEQLRAAVIYLERVVSQ